MKVTVLVPTYRRPADLARCLAALQRQSRAPDEVVVVARADDEATHACLRDPAVPGKLPLSVALVEVPGQVAALNRGLDAANGDVIAITDDDAAPHQDWVERIAAAFESDARLGRSAVATGCMKRAACWTASGRWSERSRRTARLSATITWAWAAHAKSTS